MHVLLPCMEQQYYNDFGSQWREWQVEWICLVGAVVNKWSKEMQKLGFSLGSLVQQNDYK